MKVKYHVNRTEPIKVKAMKYRKKRPRKTTRKYQKKQVAGNILEALFIFGLLASFIYCTFFL